MATRAYDDREHRRGLVLGLTLAEVLLLLLFLMLLALFWRLDDVSRNLKASEEHGRTLEGALKELAPVAAELKAGGVSEDTIQEVSAKLADVSRLQQENADLKSELAPLQSLKGMLPSNDDKAGWVEAVRYALEHAKVVSPDDLPAALRRAVDIVEAARGDPEVLDQLKSVMREATDLQPDDPGAAMMAGIQLQAEIRERLRDSVERKIDSAEISKLVISALKAGGGPGEHDWPPIINLTEAGGYRFQSGSAELTSDFVSLLKGGVIQQLRQIVQKYNVSVVEVVGHTDEQAIAPRVSNLDERLVGFFRTEGDVKSLVPADNAGLGMARAAAVAKILIADKALADLHLNILPLSGAQMIDNGDELTAGKAGDLRERRRIEIRVRRLSTPSTVQ